MKGVPGGCNPKSSWKPLTPCAEGGGVFKRRATSVEPSRGAGPSAKRRRPVRNTAFRRR